MKNKSKTWIAVLVGAVLISGVGLGIQYISADPSTDSEEGEVSKGEVQRDDEMLSTQEVRDIVGEKYPGEITELEVEREDGQLVYELEIESAEGEYEMKVDAYSGHVLKLEDKPYKGSKDQGNKNEKDDKGNKSDQGDKVDKSNKEHRGDDPSHSARISIQEAKEIALNEVPGRLDEIELDREDGFLIYEVEIDTEKGEVEVEVDAYTGEIIMIEFDD